MGERLTKIEVLSPAGDFERLHAAIRYGADAVYLAGKEFGMRATPANFSDEELPAAVQVAHGKGVPVYLTCNTLPVNEEMKRLPAFLERTQDMGMDGLIVSDLGVLRLCKRYAPNVPVHVSTQAGIVNFETACMFYDLGVSRVVLARELSLPEIAEIRAKTPKKLEIEAFVHGAMCVSFSGRCLLSSYLTGRDANRGDCAQPCRWKYAVVEEKRPGEYIALAEDDRGTYLFNSRDMCMIEHIPALVSAGITSLKIEGRAKSAYYVAVTTNAYRCAVDEYLACADKDRYKVSDWIVEETAKTSHRGYSTGFYFGDEPGQATKSGGYIRGYDFIAVAEGYQDGQLILSQRNRFFTGETVEVLEPARRPFSFVVEEMFDGEGQPISSAPHPVMTVRVPFDRPLVAGAILRRKNG